MELSYKKSYKNIKYMSYMLYMSYKKSNTHTHRQTHTQYV